MEVIESRRQGNEDNVKRILAEQKKERARRKSEKANGQEAAYRHLQITRERRPQGRPRKIQLQSQETPEVSRFFLCQAVFSLGRVFITIVHVISLIEKHKSLG